MAIWVFGDSFLKHFPTHPDSWVELTSKQLNQEVTSYAKNLSTVEYTFFKFNEMKHQIKENDILIISLTLLLRRWFFIERPFIIDGVRYVNDQEQEAIYYYDRFLKYNTELHQVYAQNFLYNVHNLTEKLNLHTIIFPNFFDFDNLIKKIEPELPLLNFVVGRLGIISDYEFDNKIVETSGVEWFMKRDIRLNHLIKSNHKILSEKVIDNIKNKTKINLTKDMVQGVLDNRMLTDPEVFKNELFERPKI